jgi:branched-chain amino acid transport system permease protein
VEALGVNIGAVYAGVLALGAGLAGLAGAVAGPLLSVQSGMGDPILVLTLVVIVLGGIGSSRGAFIAALIVGLIDTAGRAFIPLLFRMVADRSVANAAGPAVASMLIYCVMAAILALKPDGLFPIQRRKA